ncbi:MAG: ion channel [Mariprofundaceae bacterium]|nr:ion channel [Mariprofundaceae bacterium]
MKQTTRRRLLERLLDGGLLLVTLLSVGLSLWQQAPAWAGFLVLLVFVILFMVRWKVADDRAGYLRANWLDLALVVLLASPALRLLVAFKVAGLAPVLRLTALIRGNQQKLIRMLVLSSESLPAAMALIFGVVFLFGASVFLLERGHNPAFGQVSDGLWWAFVTLTTVGYGDIVPITSGGRIVAVLTMVFGITLYSLMIANLTYFVESIGKKREMQQQEDAALKKRLTDKKSAPMFRRPRKLRIVKKRLHRG